MTIPEYGLKGYFLIQGQTHGKVYHSGFTVTDHDNIRAVSCNIFDFNDIQNAMDKSVADKANIVKSVVKIA